MKKILFILLILPLIIFTGCSQKDAEYSEYDPEYVDDMQQVPDVPDDGGDVNLGGDDLATLDSPALANQKIIYRSTMSMVSSDLVTSYNTIITHMENYDSYFEGENINGDRYVLKIRVLSTELSDLIEDIKGVGDLITYSRTSENVTNRYSQFEATYDALLIQYDQVEALFIAATTESAQINYLKRLTDINTEILEVTADLNNFDSLIDYSTIDLTITRIENINSLLTDSVNPRMSHEEVLKKEFILTVYNNSENSADIFVSVKENGKVVKTYTREAYADSNETFEVSGLKSNTQYKIEVYTLEEGHLPSDVITKIVTTDSTYFSRVGDTLMSSLDILLSIVQFIFLAFVALSPYALVAGILFVPSRIIYKKFYKKDISE